MLFQFVMWNHNSRGQRSLEDVIGSIGYQLRALGHRAQWTPGSADFIGAKDGVNVIVEGFVPVHVADLARATAAGARFLCIATEEPTPDGFNHGTQREMVERQRIFPEAARHFEGILHLVPGDHVTSWYSRWAPSAYAELGHAPELERLGADRMVLGVEPDPPYDFGFYGSLSKRRARLLRHIIRQLGGGDKVLRHVTDFVDQATRDSAMREAKVILQIRKFDEMQLVSSSRCARSLLLGRPVVAEPHGLSRPWDQIVRFAESDESFLSEAMAVRGAWRGTWAAQMDRFKQMLTPRACVGEPLERIGFFERVMA